MTTKTTDIQETGAATTVLLIDFRKIEIEEGFNVRYDMGDLQQLADSIYASGMRNSLHGYASKTNKGNYILTDGHRRYEAHKLLIAQNKFDVTKDRIKITPCPRTFSEDDRIFDMFICNDSKALTFPEMAELVARLLGKGWNQKQISERIGRDKNGVFVGNLVRLNTAPKNIKNKIQSGKISASLIMDILKNEKEPEELFQLIEELEKQPEVKKITQKHINKARNIESSLTFFKQIMHTSDEYIKPEMLATRDIMRNIITGKYKNLDIEKLFLA
jgi:hypothetical protein